MREMTDRMGDALSSAELELYEDDIGSNGSWVY